MIRSFKGRVTEGIFYGRDTGAARRTCPRQVWRIAARKLDQLDSVRRLSDLRIPPANRLERLRGRRQGQYSMPINDQYRIYFTWTEPGPDAVDYH